MRLLFLKWIKEESISISGICDKKNDTIGERIYGVEIVDTNIVVGEADLIIATNGIVFDYLLDKTDAKIVNLEKYCPL